MRGSKWLGGDAAPERAPAHEAPYARVLGSGRRKRMGTAVRAGNCCSAPLRMVASPQFHPELVPAVVGPSHTAWSNRTRAEMPPGSSPPHP